MTTSPPANIPGEISSKALLLTVLAFVVFDTSAYLWFSNLSRRATIQPKVVSVDNQLDSLEQRIARGEERLNALDAQVRAAATLAAKAELGASKGMPRSEFERLKHGMCHDLKPCDLPKPCQK